MTAWQKAIKYTAIAFAIFLCVSIVGGILSLFTSVSVFFGGKDAVGDMQTYEITGTITRLHIEIGASNFVIKTDDHFHVESNHKYLTVEEKDGALKLTEKKKFWNVGKGNGRLELYIPADTVFEKVEFESGAGTVEIQELLTDRLDFELGAGNVQIDRLVAASSADIDGGAGRIVINGASLANLDMDMGVGELRLTGSLTGNCSLDLGVGATKLALAGTKEDYRIAVDKGLGEITIDGSKVSDGTVYGNGANALKIDGGVGEIKISFEEP